MRQEQDKTGESRSDSLPGMIWLNSATQTALHLPAFWLVETGEKPANLDERSALRRSVATTILARQLGLPPEGVTIAHDARGRPLLGKPTGTGLHLSLATRAGVVALGLAEAAVGVDVELVDPAGELPPASLHPKESQALTALSAPERPSAFARLWAAKEAYVKALGTGFLRPPESFAVAFDPSGGFTVHDPERTKPIRGASRIFTKSGGQEILAAAIVVLEPEGFRSTRPKI